MKATILTLTACLMATVSLAHAQQSSSDRKIEEIIGQMSLEEKIDFIGGFDDFYIRAFPKYGIPQIKMSDGPVGVRNYGPATAFPASINLTASFDTGLARRVGDAIGMEARAKNVHIMLGPAMNMHRAPMCGRNFEYLGEDPYLAGKIAASFINGMQSERVMSTAKHYMGNDQEYDRNNVSSDMDERTMREIYLPAFEAAVKEGHTAAIMTSYNLVNGVHASQDSVITRKILKHDWQFPGLVMSDWSSTYDGIAAANGGLDLEMPSGEFMCRAILLPAIKNGIVQESTIDDKVRRILREYARFDYFEHPDIAEGFVLDSSFVRQAALDDARGGIVLLKNENRILPLANPSLKTVTVIGPNATPAVTGGGGSSYVEPRVSVSFLDAFRRLAPKKYDVAYESGEYGDDMMPAEFYDTSEFTTVVDGKSIRGMSAAFYSDSWAKGEPVFRKNYPAVNLDLNDSLPGIPRRLFSVHFTGKMTAKETGIYRFVVSTTAWFRLTVDGKDVYESWGSYKERAHSVLLSLETGKTYEIVLKYSQWDTTGMIRLGYEKPSIYKFKCDQAISRAAALASKSDFILLCLGFNNETESEGSDRTFALPEKQRQLIEKILATGKDVVVILNAGGNVDMRSWLGGVKGLVHAWYPGGEGNLAVTEILLGITNPSGKLPVSFEKRWEDNATYGSYYDDDGDKRVVYSEGVFLGYRHFDKENIEPQFPFGFGLSYTSFEFTDLTVDAERTTAEKGVTVGVTVKNTGAVDGAEVVQLYVGDPSATAPRPVKELKGFAKVFLKAGESKPVRIVLHEDAFRYFHPDVKKWTIDPGRFDILIGSSSRDIRLKKTISIE